MAEGPAGKSQAYVSLSRGWALGSAGFKQDLIHDHALAATARAWEREGAEEIRASRGEGAMEGGPRSVPQGAHARFKPLSGPAAGLRASRLRQSPDLRNAPPETARRTRDPEGEMYDLILSDLLSGIGAIGCFRGETGDHRGQDPVSWMPHTEP